MTRTAAAVMLGIAAAAAIVTCRGPERSDTDTSAADTAVVPSSAPAAPAPAPSRRDVASPAERQRPAASGGVAILASAARAQAVVTGVVSEVASLDVHGWRAALRVDGVLLGDVRLGDTVIVGWEELSTQRQVRFTDGERVLLVLDPLPSQSLWRKRFAIREPGRAVLVVASDGEAFLSRPDGVTLDALEHYLAMTPEARAGSPGAGRLAELVLRGHPAVGREALTLLEGQPALVQALDADGRAALLGAAQSPERDLALRRAALALAARHRLPGTREVALALSAPPSPIRADAYRALVALPDGLPADRLGGLLDDADPDVRALGVAAVRDEDTHARVATLARADPSPTVRLAAGRALLARGDKIGDVVGLLDDPDATVRNGIAESIGPLGDIAVGPLLAVVEDGSERAALAAILGLSRAGRQGGAAVMEIAETHPNTAVRAFARLALGEAPGHKH